MKVVKRDFTKLIQVLDKAINDLNKLIEKPKIKNN